MPRYIDAYALIDDIRKYSESYFADDFAHEWVDKQPSADVQPVVRCKDCKHRHLDGMIWNCPFGLPGGEGFFCAYGAKDGEQND